MAPEVSVVMPVRDGAEFLGAAIDSVLDQTWVDFELLVVDDGSTDASPSIARRYAARDGRVRLIQICREGLPGALNRGIAEAVGRYVARADADDLNLPLRLAAQVDFLERHPHVGLCGTAIESFGSGMKAITRLPASPRTLHCMLLFQSPLAHPTVMMRTELVRACGYDVDFRDGGEDYDLWERLANRTSLANLPQVLCRYRLHQRQMSNVHREGAEAAAGRVRDRQLDRLGLQASAEERELHHALCKWNDLDAAALRRLSRWLERIADANARMRIYPEPEMGWFLAGRWYRACADSGESGMVCVREFLRSPLARRGKAMRLAVRRGVPEPAARSLVRMRDRLRGRFLPSGRVSR